MPGQMFLIVSPHYVYRNYLYNTPLYCIIQANVFTAFQTAMTHLLIWDLFYVKCSIKLPYGYAEISVKKKKRIISCFLYINHSVESPGWPDAVRWQHLQCDVTHVRGYAGVMFTSWRRVGCLIAGAVQKQAESTPWCHSAVLFWHVNQLSD